METNLKSNPNPYPNPTTKVTKQQAVVSIQLNKSAVLRIQSNSYETMLLHRLYFYLPLLLYLSQSSRAPPNTMYNTPTGNQTA